MKIQEMFDKVVTHLLTQNKKALGTGSFQTRCQYLAFDGSKCAAGCLIPEDQYDPKMEGQIVDLLSFFTQLADSSENSVQFMNVLGTLQEIHDGNNVDSWKEHIQACAEEYQLLLPPIAQ